MHCIPTYLEASTVDKLCISDERDYLESKIQFTRAVNGMRFFKAQLDSEVELVKSPGLVELEICVANAREDIQKKATGIATIESSRVNLETSIQA